MPSDSRTHGIEALVHSSQRRIQRAASAKANGIASDAYPMNMIGGWMTIHGFWSSGLSPWPSSGAMPVARPS